MICQEGVVISITFLFIKMPGEDVGEDLSIGWVELTPASPSWYGLTSCS